MIENPDLGYSELAMINPRVVARRHKVSSWGLKTMFQVYGIKKRVHTFVMAGTVGEEYGKSLGDGHTGF